MTITEIPDLNPREEPVRVPLIVYVGGERLTVGDALVTGNLVEAYIEPAKGRTLARAVQEGVLQNVAVTFNAPPATPVLVNGHVQWKKNF